MKRDVATVLLLLMAGCSKEHATTIDQPMRDHALEPTYQSEHKSTLTKAPSMPVKASHATSARPVGQVVLTRMASHKLSSIELDEVLKGVKSSLAEPHGASVEGVAAGSEVGKSGAVNVTACGYVRGLNRAGRESGLVPFVGLFGSYKSDPQRPAFVVLHLGDAAISRQVVVTMCRGYGLLDG